MNKAAIKAVLRLWSQIAPSLELAEEADSHFDGGEFSGPAHARIQKNQYERIIDQVATRFDMRPDDLEYEVEAFRWEESRRWMEANAIC